mgnify:CR=1 FL=1
MLNVETWCSLFFLENISGYSLEEQMKEKWANQAKRCYLGEEDTERVLWISCTSCGSGLLRALLVWFILQVIGSVCAFCCIVPANAGNSFSTYFQWLIGRCSLVYGAFIMQDKDLNQYNPAGSSASKHLPCSDRFETPSPFALMKMALVEYFLEIEDPMSIAGLHYCH